MDFVDWCRQVLAKLNEGVEASPDARLVGVQKLVLANAIFGDGTANAPDYWGSERHRAVEDAIAALEREDLVDERHGWVKMTARGRQSSTDMTALWEAMCHLPLDQQQELVLQAVNSVSVRDRNDCAEVEQVEYALIQETLGWEDPITPLAGIAHELHDQGFVRNHGVMGGGRLQATFRGLVWETRRGFVLESKEIDSLVADWETTSVDFKRELHTNTASEKAELIKDIIGLANTQASGRRWLIIGFDDKTRDYHGPPNAKLSQNHFEHLLAQYTEPLINVRYAVVNYRKGAVGRLEVLRDRTKLPYRVAKSLGDKAQGDKKRIEQGQMFVRHGSQTEAPTPDELRALQEESDRARIAANQ